MLITHTELGYGEEEGSVDVCEAIREMREEERLKGEKIGEARGKKIGEVQGRKIGEAQAEKRMNQLVRSLIQDGRLDDLKRSVDDRTYQEELLAEYGII